MIRRLDEGLSLRPGSDPESRAFCEAHPLASPYHDPFWWDLLSRSFGYTSVVVVQSRDGHVRGVAPACVVNPLVGPRRLVSLPFSHDVPPLCAEGGSVEALLRGLRLAAPALRCASVELRAEAAVAESFELQPALLQTRVKLTGDDASQLSAMKESTRQQTVQGLRFAGLDVATAKSIDEVRLSFHLVSETRRRKGSLTYPLSLFEGLLPLIEAGRALIEVARLHGRPIATTVTIVRNRTAIYLYGGSHGDEASLRARPNNVLLFRALRFAREAGASVLDLGTSLPAQTGLVRFKEGLGGLTTPLAYLAWPRAVSRPEQDGFLARVAGTILTRLPLPVFERITPLVLKQVG